MFSAATFGSSLTARAFIRSTVPVTSGSVDRASGHQLQRRISLGADLIGQERRRGDVDAAVDIDVQRAIADESDAPAGVNLAR